MMTITDLVTPPATRAVAPNRLVSSSCRTRGARSEKAQYTHTTHSAQRKREKGKGGNYVTNYTVNWELLAIRNVAVSED